MLLSELHQLNADKELISIDRTSHDDELTGLLCYVSDTLITMQLFDNEGRYDGFAAFEFDQIKEVYWGNRQHKAIRFLVDKNQPPARLILESTDFENAIRELNERFSSVSLHEIGDEDIFDIAHIENQSEEWLRIKTFAPQGSLSRMHKIIRVDTISRVVVDSPYQNSIHDLHAKEF